MKRNARSASLILASAAVVALSATSCSPAADQGGTADGDQVTVTVRLWDEQVQAAYEKSFEQFESANEDINVETVIVPFANYTEKLRTDVSAGNVDDIFWVNSSTFGAYADSGNLLEIGSEFDSLKGDWVPAAIEQYTRDDVLWGVPQLTDGGIAMYYNKTMIEEAGVDLTDLSWHPTDPAQDTFLPAMQKLTVDAEGRTAEDPEFDASQIEQYGYNAALDLQAIYFNYIGSNGGTFQEDETFTFAGDKSVEAFQYVVDLINEHQVSPSAANTNDNGSFSRDQFLQGNMAVFQSGTYNLKNVSDGADFEWGIAPIPAGPEGRVSVVNNIIAAGNPDSENLEATTRVLQWMGSAEGASFIGAEGAALPAVVGAQDAYSEYWEAQGADPSQFALAAEGETIGAPVGANFNEAATAWTPIFNEIFLGRTPVGEGLQEAEDLANAVGE
ncbi:sugar ABC transporter substrate-binding protein [Arthrobacter sp. H5]|uniref:ABC transporter substrate-binding protein n=1 Tax=Arthrobacter sp. H5 TaxID=1267973 RepID=UPI0004809AF5|nr:sugar ABC transporter substrate-binding protein [Arthrobacter sp. H5]